MFRSLKERFGDKYKINVLSEDPWVVVFDDFISPQVLHNSLLLSSCIVSWVYIVCVCLVGE